MGNCQIFLGGGGRFGRKHLPPPTAIKSQGLGRRRDWDSRLGSDDFFFLSPHMPYGRVRLARFARVRLLRHALPISLLILRKKPTVLQSTGILDREFLLVESKALEFLIHLMESRIPPTIGIWTPKSTANESRIHNVESRIQDS